MKILKVFKNVFISVIILAVVIICAAFLIWGGFGKRPSTIKAIAHRGYSQQAPENTLPAYALAKENGFKYVECDVAFTKDGKAVLLHDSSIDRTSNGEGKLSELDYSEIAELDFGSWFSEEYAGTRIPTFEEFIIFCKESSLRPYIELKSSGDYTREQINSLVDTVYSHGMQYEVSWISFDYEFLSYVKDRDDTARLGYLSSKFSDEDLEMALSLKTSKNEVFLDLGFLHAYSWQIKKCRDAGIPVEVWTLNEAIFIRIMNPYISGVTSDYLDAGKILGKK